jgi:hypothetical protein
LKEGASLALDPAGIPFGDKSRPSASIMRVPLRLRTNKVTGVVAIHSYTPKAYTAKDLKTLQTLADCCGVAVERIWADEALRQSESQFRLVWESSGDGMRLTNREGIILRVNDAYCRMVQKSRAELGGPTPDHRPQRCQCGLCSGRLPKTSGLKNPGASSGDGGYIMERRQSLG